MMIRAISNATPVILNHETLKKGKCYIIEYNMIQLSLQQYRSDNHGTNLEEVDEHII